MARGNKAAADATPDAPKADPADTKDKKKGSGAPRPRKFEYGIAPDSTIARLADEPNVKRDVKGEWEYTEGNPTCAVFFTRGGTRHGLRVMSRRKLITITGADGKQYPVTYVAPVKEPKPEKVKDAAAA